MSVFSRRDYETLARIMRRVYVDAHRHDWDCADMISAFSAELEKENPNFHKELFFHNIFCNDSHSFDNNCPYSISTPVPTLT